MDVQRATEPSGPISPPAMRRSGSSRVLLNKQVYGLSVTQVKEALLDLLPDHGELLQEHVFKALCFSDAEYEKVLELLDENMNRGLSPDTHPTANIRMFPTYVRELPDGTETGRYLSLDFSGKNFRLHLFTLADGTITDEVRNGIIPDRMLDSPGTQLFDHIASSLHRFLEQMDMLNTAETLPLGFSFHFTCEYLSINKGVLVAWSKNFHCEDVEGHDVVELLEDAIKRKGEMNVKCTAFLNDTVGVLVAGAYEDRDCAVGMILSRGTNVSYVEDLERVEIWDGDNDPPRQVIVNTEWHNFGEDGCLDFIRSEYDIEVDKHSKHPGKHTFDKMTGALFLGEIVRLVLQKIKDGDALFQEHWTQDLATPNRFFTKYISEILSEEDVRFKRTRHVLHDLELHEASELECRVIHHICQLVSLRAATLIGVGLACVLNRMVRRDVAIAVDGALFRFHPLFEDLLLSTVPRFLKQETNFRFVPAIGGSGKGAAIVAAVVDKKARNPEKQTTP